jgi:DNA polymerase
LNPEEVLREIAEQVRVCTRCQLHHSRKNTVPGAGNAHTSILFIGEGPGFHENEQGLPFVGASGKFLDELLQEAGLTREEVFITNVVKCRPPGNRDPQTEELQACKHYLDRQIAAINPDVIVTLGRISMGYYITNGKISSIHGKSFWANGRMVIPMYHPAAALHQPSLRSVVKEDFAKLPQLLEKALETRRNNPNLAAMSQASLEEDTLDENGTEQLSLF